MASPSPTAASPVPKTFRRRRRLFLRRRQITAIDVDGQVLRVVQTLHRAGQTKVTRFAALPLDLAPDAERSDPVAVGTAIAKALGKLAIKPGDVVMGVPRALVVLRTLFLPPTESRGELAAMVHFQIAKDLPFRLEEAVIDFKVHGPLIPLTTDNKADKAPDRKPETPSPETKLAVLVAAAKHEVVSFYQQIAAAAGLKLVSLGLRPYANARCVEACRLTEQGENAALISVRPDEVVVDVLVDQSLVFSRVVSVPSSTPEPSATGPTDSPPEEPPSPLDESGFAQAVTIEVVRSLHSYEGTLQQGKVRKLIVAGGTGYEPAVVDALAARFNWPCSLLDPASALGLPESKREHAPGALVAFGLGLGVNDPEGLPFDFLNPKKPAKPRNVKRIKILAAAATGLILVLGLFGFRSHLIKERLKQREGLVTQLTSEESKRPLYRQLRSQNQVVQAWIREDRSWLDHYAYLSAVLPLREDLYVNTLTTGNRENLRLSVQARSGEIIAKLDQLLRAAGYEVKPLAITPSPDKYGYQFKSNVELVLPTKMKVDLPKLLGLTETLPLTNTPAPQVGQTNKGVQ